MRALQPAKNRPTTVEVIFSTGRTLSLLAVLVGLAWGTGQPFVFPSLGPSAYALAITPSAATSQWQRTIGGHFFGVLSGMVAYHALAPGLTIVSTPSAFSPGGFRLVLSGFVAVGLTTIGMLRTDYRHAPACATTLIISLGLLTTVVDAAIIMVSVCLLVLVDSLLPAGGVAGR